MMPKFVRLNFLSWYKHLIWLFWYFDTQPFSRGWKPTSRRYGRLNHYFLTSCIYCQTILAFRGSHHLPLQCDWYMAGFSFWKFWWGGQDPPPTHTHTHTLGQVSGGGTFTPIFGWGVKHNFTNLMGKNTKYVLM